MNIVELLFVGMPVDMNVHTNVKIFCVYYFYMNSSKLDIYGSVMAAVVVIVAVSITSSHTVLFKFYQDR